MTKQPALLRLTQLGLVSAMWSFALCAKPLWSAEGKMEPCFYASWDESLSADKSSGAVAPVKTALAMVDPKSAYKGKAGLNAQMDGAHVDYVPADMWPVEEGTVAFWYRPSFDVATNENNHGLLYGCPKKDHTANDFNIRFAASAKPINELQVVYQAQGEVKLAATKPAWKAGEWHHIAVTWGKEELTLYLDGKETTSTEMPRTRHTIEQPLIVGSVFGNNANADFDELTICPKAFDPEQIKKLFEESRKKN